MKVPGFKILQFEESVPQSQGVSFCHFVAAGLVSGVPITDFFTQIVQQVLPINFSLVLVMNPNTDV